MHYFIFNLREHSDLIHSFLKSATMAHKHDEVRREDWFTWKFLDNPFGSTILACAEESGQIVGCVAYGIQPFVMGEKIINCAVAFENFVHPKYQGRGIFKKLISLAEKAAFENGLSVLFVFPNRNSLQGYLRMGWQPLRSPEYWTNARNIFLHWLDLRKPFRHKQSNLNELNSPKFFQQSIGTKNLTSVIDLDYLNWRFFTYPVGEYAILDTENFYSILRIGNRGRVTEAQVLFINPKFGGKCNLGLFISSCRLKWDYDLISIPISGNNPLRSQMISNLFIKVPSRANMCYKILDSRQINEKQVAAISLNGINYHTY